MMARATPSPSQSSPSLGEGKVSRHIAPSPCLGEGWGGHLLRCLHARSRLLPTRFRTSSLALRVRSRRWFRGLRQAALWCWSVGDDVEIVGHRLHGGGSSFC